MSARRKPRSTADLLGDEPEKRQRGRPIAPHRERLVNAQAELAEIRAKRLRGELLPVAEVEREWAAICADIRQALLAAPARCAARGVPAEAVEALDKEIRAILSRLAAQSGLPDADGHATA